MLVGALPASALVYPFLQKSYPQPRWVRKSRPFPFQERVCDFLLGLFHSPFMVRVFITDLILQAGMHRFQQADLVF